MILSNLTDVIFGKQRIKPSVQPDYNRKGPIENIYLCKNVTAARTCLTI